MNSYFEMVLRTHSAPFKDPATCLSKEKSSCTEPRTMFLGNWCDKAEAVARRTTLEWGKVDEEADFWQPMFGTDRLLKGIRIFTVPLAQAVCQKTSQVHEVSCSLERVPLRLALFKVGRSP